MRKPLTDSLCAELAKDFKPFKVRRNPIKPQSGFNTSTTYTVTELRMNALKQWVVSFNSDSCWLAQNFDMIVDRKAEPKRIVRGLTENGSRMHGSFLMVDDDGYTWISNALGSHKLVAIEYDNIQVKAQQIDDKLKSIDWKPSEPNPDNQTVNALVQYVSEHRDSMSKESLMHFANLIGLIKLGAL
jgi:hypothetical protein